MESRSDGTSTQRAGSAPRREPRPGGAERQCGVSGAGVLLDVVPWVLGPAPALPRPDNRPQPRPMDLTAHAGLTLVAETMLALGLAAVVEEVLHPACDDEEALASGPPRGAGFPPKWKVTAPLKGSGSGTPGVSVHWVVAVTAFRPALVILLPPAAGPLVGRRPRSLTLLRGERACPRLHPNNYQLPLHVQIHTDHRPAGDGAQHAPVHLDIARSSAAPFQGGSMAQPGSVTHAISGRARSIGLAYD